ncbi:MAG: hypothetical protein HWN68_12845 [Desulfobacterales bacterium]|nr:hypothetical protein [Desulfobacterales bacterium]
MNDKYKAVIVIVGIIGFVIIEVMAMYNNINGTVLSAIVGAITLIIGYCFGIFKRDKDTSTDS